MKTEKHTQVIASDAGGTMTDIIIVDSEGSFSVGKATSTPGDESVGLWEALKNAFSQWDTDLEKETHNILPSCESIVYSGTSMINVLLTETGKRIGIITQRGDEDIFLHERSRQTWAGYTYKDVQHHVTHTHNKSLVPRRLVKGVEGRISMFGTEAIPLYEDDVRRSVEELLDDGVDGIGVCLWYSYLNPVHELRVSEIAGEIMEKRGTRIPVHLSHRLAPIMREQSRMNTVVLHAYAVEPGRKQLFKIEHKLQERGYKYPLQILLSHGGVTNIRYPRLHEACFSGPIGGLLGVRYIAQVTGIANWVCSDVGGTSFDVGLIMDGEPILEREVVIDRRLYNIPTLLLNSIAAGGGSYVTVDPITKRIYIGPKSAGAAPGPVCYDKGNDVPTITDCALVMGILNQDNFLGGRLKVNKDLALKAIKEKCADVLGVDPYYVADGVYRLINSHMREHIRSVLYPKGFSPADYCLLAYGGGGPVHVMGYTAGLPFKGIATVPWAAAFSSFGCAAVDMSHRYQKSTAIMIPYGADDGLKLMMGQMVNTGWDELIKQAKADFDAEGLPWKQAKVQPTAYVRYGGQMEDLEVPSPISRINTPEDMDQLIAAFEDLYGRIHSGVAKYQQAGYQIFEVGLVTTVAKVKPKLVKRSLEGKKPPRQAIKGKRKVYLNGQWHMANIYDMGKIKPGNEIAGVAVVEAPTTTLFVPPDKCVRMDEWSLLWLT